MNELQPRLGIDFGRVIQGATLEAGTADTVFLSGDDAGALASPPSPDAFEVLARLVPMFGGRAWVVSKCGPRVEDRTRRWLDHHDFYAETGVPVGNVRFCRKRGDKLPHCAELGITHMIDDRLDVHRALRGTVPNLYLFGVQPEPAPEWVLHTPDWAAVEVAVTASLG